MFKITYGKADLHNHYMRKEIDRIHGAVLDKLNIVSVSKMCYLYSLRNNFDNPITVALIGKQLNIHPGKKRALIKLLTGERYLPSVFIVASSDPYLGAIPFIQDAEPYDNPVLTRLYGSNIWTINVEGQKNYAGNDNENNYNKSAQEFFKKNIIYKHGNIFVESKCGYKFSTDLSTDKKTVIEIEDRKQLFTELFKLVDNQ